MTHLERKKLLLKLHCLRVCGPLAHGLSRAGVSRLKRGGDGHATTGYPVPRTPLSALKRLLESLKFRLLALIVPAGIRLLLRFAGGRLLRRLRQGSGLPVR